MIDMLEVLIGVGAYLLTKKLSGILMKHVGSILSVISISGLAT